LAVCRLPTRQRTLRLRAGLAGLDAAIVSPSLLAPCSCAELTLVFEETLNIDITDEEASRIRTVRDAIISVEKCLRAQRRG
jgi:hypothetical protein